MRLGHGSSQDAGDSARLLEAPNPLVLMVVVIPSWWWRQRGKTGVALRTILTRLVPPGALARMILPAVLTRPVAPLLARATVVPASASTPVAPVTALGALTEASFSYGSELLIVAGVVGVQVMEGAEWLAYACPRLGELVVVSSLLMLLLPCDSTL